MVSLSRNSLPIVDNKLSLHLGKTECILFGSRKKLRKVGNFGIDCNGHSIQAQSSVKYSGVNLDKFLAGEAIANDMVGGKKGNRTEPNHRIIPDRAYGNFRYLRYRVLPPSPNRTIWRNIYLSF